METVSEFSLEPTSCTNRLSFDTNDFVPNEIHVTANFSALANGKHENSVKIMADSESVSEEAQQLQKQLENIYLDYRKTLDQSMAPKDISTRKVGASGDGGEEDDNELGGLSIEILFFCVIQLSF